MRNLAPLFILYNSKVIYFVKESNAVLFTLIISEKFEFGSVMCSVGGWDKNTS